MLEIVKIYTDGGSRGNPGPAAAGILIFDQNNQLLKIDGKYLGDLTNNQAEYEALLIALRIARRMKVQTIKCYLDSLLIVNQLKGLFKVKSPNIRGLKLTADRLLMNFTKAEFYHIRREKNKLADKLVNIVLDSVLKG